MGSRIVNMKSAGRGRFFSQLSIVIILILAITTVVSCGGGGSSGNGGSSPPGTGSGKTWSTAQPLEFDNAGSALYPQIAMDSTDNALVVWQHSDGIRSNIWANHYE